MTPRPFLGTALAGALVLGLSSGPAPAETAPQRTVSGTLEYLARIALPPEAEVMVEMRDLTGRRLGALSEGTVGAQVPLPFALTVEGSAAGALRPHDRGVI